MKIFILCTVIFTMYFFVQCNSPNELDVHGIYISPKLKNNIDTLILYKNGFYKRLLYKKSDKSLLLKHGGKWSYKSGNIELHYFFLDQDNVYSKERNFSSDDMIHVYFSVDKLDYIEFDYGVIPDQRRYIYRKIIKN